MKIIIETNTEATPEEVFAYFKQKTIEALQEFTLKIEGTELNYECKK